MEELIIIVSIVLACAGFLAMMYGIGIATVYIVARVVNVLSSVARYFRRY